MLDTEASPACAFGGLESLDDVQECDWGFGYAVGGDGLDGE